MKSTLSGSAALFLASAFLFTAQAAQAQFVLADDVQGTHFGSDDGVITPNGRIGIVRENGAATAARFYDMSTGALLVRVASSMGSVGGVAQDAVVCTDTRAAALGSSLMIFDLGLLPANPLISELDMGFRPRDLEVTPDGSLIVIRGGTVFGGQGIMAVVDLTTGQLLATTPGLPPDYPSSRHSFDVDSVAVTDTHAVCTSIVGVGTTDMTRVTIWELRPAAGGAPQVVFESDALTGTDQYGAPHDLAISPDGLHCAVRSELQVACYSLNSGQSAQLWNKRLAGAPGLFGNSALDSIEVTNAVIATISRQSNPAFTLGAQVDLFDMAGRRSVDRIDGDPHDLALDSSGLNLVVRTNTLLAHYDLGAWTPGGPLQAQSEFTTAVGSHTSWGAGLDSLAVSGTRSVALVRVDQVTNIYVHDFSSGTLLEVGMHVMDDIPVDLAITPDGERCAVSGLHSVDVVDMNTGAGTLAHSILVQGTFPWCDGVVVSQDRVLAFGVSVPISQGWTSVLDLFGQPVNYCTSAPNSVGPGARIYANGSASLFANNFELLSAGMPSGQLSQFFYGSMTQSTPFGNGFLCVAGNPVAFSVSTSSVHGVARQAVDFSALPAGGSQIVPGSTFRFQCLYRDGAAGGGGFNLSGGLEVVFGL